jgi:apolipoprotein N-acyltransferase
VFAQPDWSLTLSLLASTIGYGLAFKALTALPSRRQCFLIATLFFAIIQFVHLSWFMADEYVGSYIYLVLICLVLGLGAQFGLFVLFIPKFETVEQKMTLFSVLGLASFWVLLEWVRLFFLSGYPFNPTGLALSATLYGMQLTSILGIFGLSFWVIMTNLFFYKRAYSLFIIAALFPYLFGWISVTYHDFQIKKKKEDAYSVVLVQTGLKPEQKIPFDSSSQPLSPVEQWEHILSLLQPYQDKELDLILFSEGQVPYGTSHPYYSRSMVENVIKKYLKMNIVFPETLEEKVGNSFWAQSLSNAFNADVIIGLEDVEYPTTPIGRPHVYNAAFVYSPFNEDVRRYEKRVLVPMGEYIPFAWCKKILSKYGITDSYKRGEKAKVFKTERASYGLSICYEEAFGHLMRENRLHRANILVNLTNDIWYPRSRLPYVHYLHGRLRAVEGGIPLVRACNSGVTCGIDSMGRLIHLNDMLVLSDQNISKTLTNMLLFESSKTALLPASCHLFVPSYSSFTVYTYFGDWLIVGISFLFLLSSCTLFLHKKVRKR